MERLRAAVIGFGHLGRFHAEKLAASADAILVAIVDADRARAEAAAEHFRCRAETELDAVLDAADVAIVAVPTESHFAVSKRLLEAGVHVLVEKPIARTREEADALVAAADARGVVLQVGHVERFNPAFAALAAGKKRALYIEAERLAPFRGRGADVDVVLDLMIHDVDLALALAGAEVESLDACGFAVLTGSVDIANARLGFANGCVANLSASRVSRLPVRKLRLFERERYVSADLDAGRLRVVRRAADGVGIEEDEATFADRDALAAQTRAFLAAVRNGARPVVSGADARSALDIALRIGEQVGARLALHRLEG